MDEAKFRNRLAGQVRFPEDLTNKKMVHAMLIRAPHSPGVLEGIDLPELNEDMLFLKADDLPGKNLMPLPDCSIPLLAEDRILYPGQPVGILCAPNQESLNRISRKIRCRIRRLPSFPPPGNKRSPLLYGAKENSKRRPGPGIKPGGPHTGR